jgi:anti-sigma factor RsiW
MLISRYADGEAMGSDAARAARHLETCAPCRELLREWREQHDLFAWVHTYAMPVVESDPLPLPDGGHGTSLTVRRPAGRRWPAARAWVWASAACCATVAALAVWYGATLPPVLGRAADGRTTPEVRLALGVRLELGADTSVTRLGRREVQLNRGWLRADVRRGNIIVRTKRMEVRDIGTRFQVATGQKADTVFVEAGAVEVRHGSATTMVHSNQLLTERDKGAPVVSGFPAWTKEEDAEGQRLVSTEPFRPASDVELHRREALVRLAERFPSLRRTGKPKYESSAQYGWEYAVTVIDAAGLRAGLRAHISEIARGMAGETRGLGTWAVSVGVLGVNGASVPAAVPAGFYRLQLASTGHALVWDLDDGKGNVVRLPVMRAPRPAYSLMTPTAAGVAAGPIHELWTEKGTEYVLQLADWPGAVKPTLRLRLTGQSLIGSHAETAERLTAVQQATKDVSNLKTGLVSSTLLYLDPSRRHHLFLAWNGMGNLPLTAQNTSPGGSLVVAAVLSDLGWKSPVLAPGVYLLWWVWAPGEARAHWEMSRPDGTDRRRLDDQPAIPPDDATYESRPLGLYPDHRTGAMVYLSLPLAEDGTFPVAFQLQTRLTDPRGRAGWMRVAQPSPPGPAATHAASRRRSAGISRYAPGTLEHENAAFFPTAGASVRPRLWYHVSKWTPRARIWGWGPIWGTGAHISKRQFVGWANWGRSPRGLP